MKKILCILLLLVPLLLSGCGKLKDTDVIKEIKKKYEKSSGYQLKGELEITNNDEVYSYDVLVDYMKDSFYKVSFVNQANDFQQIILKNNDGVFLLTPSLNKSFKFQNNWPYSNSQIYLLDALIQDIDDDEELSFERKDDSFVLHTKVDYPNNRKLVKQTIIFDSDYNLKSVTVYDRNDVVCMSFIVSNIQYSPKYEESYFELDSIIEEKDNNKDEVKETSVIEDVVYPLLLPEGTKLVHEERVSKDDGERVLMTYDGEKSFLLVEETLDVFHDFMVIPSTGEPFQLMDTIGVMTDNSLSWSSGNIEYYLVSDVMSQDELIEVAQSIVGINSFK